MNKVLTIIQTILSIAVIVLILMQARGTGFGRGSSGGASFSRRGLEKLIFRLTFVAVAALLVISVLQLLV